MVQVLSEMQLKRFYSSTILDQMNADQSLVPYFVTMSFVSWYPMHDRNKILSQDGIITLRKHHNNSYRSIVSRCMNNFTRKLHLHPLVYSFVDFEMTAEMPDRIIMCPEHPHTHDIWLVPEKTDNIFVQMLMEDFSDVVKDRANPYLRQVHAELIKDPIADMEKLISYSAKFVTGPQGRRLQERGVALIDQLPQSRSERKVRLQPNPTKCKERFHDDPIGTFDREQKRRIGEFYRSAGLITDTKGSNSQFGATNPYRSANTISQLMQ